MRGVAAAEVLRRSGTLQLHVDCGAGAAVEARAAAARAREQLRDAHGRLAATQALARRQARELEELRGAGPGGADVAPCVRGHCAPEDRQGVGYPGGRGGARVPLEGAESLEACQVIGEDIHAFAAMEDGATPLTRTSIHCVIVYYAF